MFRSCLHWKTEPRPRLLARNHWGNGASAVTAKVGQSFRKRSGHIHVAGAFLLFGKWFAGKFRRGREVRRKQCPRRESNLQHRFRKPTTIREKGFLLAEGWHLQLARRDESGRVELSCSAPAGKRSAQHVPSRGWGARGRAGERPCTIRLASNASLSTPEARGWRYGGSGTMAADSRRRHARRAGKLEREGFARRRERGEGVAVAGRGAGERSEAGRGDTARSA